MSDSVIISVQAGDLLGRPAKAKKRGLNKLKGLRNLLVTIKRQ